MSFCDDLPIESLIGKTFISVKNNGDRVNFIADDLNPNYVMLHEQHCCESVSVEDVIGDLSDLENSPILQASEVVHSDSDDERSPDSPGPQNEYDDGWTWTFYRISTIKGTVVIRWYGSSNGYYSESVSLQIGD